MEQEIDSLEQALKNAAHDTTRVNIMSLLTRAYGGIDSVQCFKNGFEAIALSKKINYLKGTTDAHIALAGGYLDYYDLDNAEKHYRIGNNYAEKLIAKDSSKQNLKLWMRGNYNLGVTYGYRGDSDKEISYARKTLPVAQKIKDTLFIAITYTNLGIKYTNFKRYNEAYKSFSQSGALYEALNLPNDYIYDGLAFAILLHGMDSISQMKNVMDKVKFYLDENPNSINWHLYHSQMGLYWSKRKQYDKALASLDKSFALLKEKKMKLHYGNMYQKFSNVYDDMGDYKKSMAYTEKRIAFLAETNNKVSMLTSYIKMARYKEKDNNYKSANEYLKKYIVLEDSLERKTTAANMKTLELEYKNTKRENELLELQNTNNETALSLEKKKSQAYFYGIIIGALLITLLLGYLAYRSKVKQQKRKELGHKQELSALKLTQEAKIFAAMIEGQEKERKRLAIDLHDGLGGRLSGISLNLSKLDKDEPKDYPKKQLQKVMKDLDNSLSELRSIARNMMPETLMKFGMQAALKDYCSSMNTAETKVTLQFYGSEKDIATNQKVTIYRVIQELINNAIKHANASEILVQYMREGDIVDITVEDNGIGIDDLKLQTGGKGMGLSNLRTRVAYLKGDLDFQSQHNEGTTVNVHLDLHAA